MRTKLSLLAIALAGATIAACGGPPAPPAGPVAASRHINAAPPPAFSTPVPIVRSKPNSNAGRSDPFVALYGPSYGNASTKRVSVNAYPRIPTLPGFEGAPGGGKPRTIWDGVRVAGIVQANGYSAIIEADGKSYVAREGETIDNNKFRVVAIGPGYVTLASSAGVRNFSLGG